MAVFSIIQKSQLEGAHRLDAEFFHPEKLQAKLILEGLTGKSVADYFINSKQAFNPTNKKLDGEAIVYDLNDALGLFLDSGTLVNSEKEIISTKKILKQKDVIISRLRSYLKEIAFVYDNNKLKLASTEFIVLRLKEKKVYPEILFSFLQTDIVQKILEWSQEGVNHPRFSENELMSLKFPDILIKNQDYIKDIIVFGSELYKNSKSLYSKAENLLLEELGLKNFNSENYLARVVNFSDVQSANRMDAEYFQIKYEKLLKRIKEKNGKSLGEIVSIKKGIEPGAESYLEEGKKFIRVSNMSKFGISGNDQKYISEDLYKKLKDDFEPKIGEILLTKDATPGIAFVLRENADGIIASGILRLKLKDKNIEDEYVALCLNSAIGKMQAERDAGGSVIAHWKPEQIQNVLIPVLPKPVQQKIADLVRQSSAARKKSQELLEEAKRKVEEMIEKK